MPGGVVCSLVVLFLEVGILHEFLVDRANSFYRYKTKVVCPETERHLARFHIMATEEVTKNIKMNLTNVPLFVGQNSVEHCSVEFALEPRKEFSIQQSLSFPDARTIQHVEQTGG